MPALNSFLYIRLAFKNLRKNANTYFPYAMTCVCSIITFYTMVAIVQNPGLQNMPGAGSVLAIMALGSIVIGIFSTILLFYTNSFLIKRRKREFGLYGVLGLEKKHIAAVLFFETFFIAIISLVLGLLGGILFGKLIFLLLLNLLSFTVAIPFFISVKAMSTTVLLFAGIFLLTLLTNLWNMHLANPIQLLQSKKQGEKEPKSSWVITLLGILTLSAGYYIAINIQSPLEALTMFFVAVILVIIGTYALFTSGSIAILKALRANKSFYYRPANFVSVSGMLYRMKQNAAGLASICILSTMVLVTIATTVSLYIGKDATLREQYPQDFTLRYDGDLEEQMDVLSLVRQEAAAANIQISDEYAYRYYEATVKLDKNHMQFFTGPYTNDMPASAYFILLEDYNRIANTTYSLDEQEILIFCNKKNYTESTLWIGDTEYQVKQNLTEFPSSKKEANAIEEIYYIVCNDITCLQQVSQALEGEPTKKESLQYVIAMNFMGADDDIIVMENAILEQIRLQEAGYSFSSLHFSKTDWYTTYGGFLFLGIFLGALFMMATVLIIYYKQISEGLDDHDRFAIMQQVGMSQQEVRKTIRKQILMVFFLPLIVAAIHISFAFKMLCKLLALFGLLNTHLILLCTCFTVLCFAIGYAFVYGMTAKSYYRLVEAKNEL